MKYSLKIFICFSLFFLFNCKSKLAVAVSTLNKIEPIYSQADSILYTQKLIETKKLSDSCEKYNLNCLIHFPEEYPNYKGGIHKFREALFKGVKVPKSSKLSKYTVEFIIGRNDSIENVKIYGTNNDKMKNEIARVLKIHSIKKNWNSGSFFRHKIKYLYELDIELLEKNNSR